MALTGSGIPSRAEIQAAIDEAAGMGIAAAALLGGMKVQWGTFTTTIGTASTTVNVTFTTAFSASPMVFCSVIDVAAASTGHRADRWGTAAVDSAGVGDTTGFVFKSNRNSGSANIRVTWIAIGTP